MTRGQMPPAVLRGVIGDEHIADLALRNQQRAYELIKRMGRKYCCHPSHAPAGKRREAEHELFVQNHRMMTEGR